MASEAVLAFLEDHNRPFSINDIQSSVKGDFGKTSIQKALDSLVENDRVKEKVYGKQKVYCVVQNNGTSAGELREHLLEVDRKINETTLQLKDVTDKLKSKSQLINAAKGKISLEDAINEKLKLDKELEDTKIQLDKYSGIEAICPKRKLAAEKENEKYLGEYKKRKRICMDVLNSILENYQKTKKQLFEEIGIETDEDAGFSINK